jgi:hypothetical protein
MRQQDLDTRIIIGSFSDEIAPKIFCEVRSEYQKKKKYAKKIMQNSVAERIEHFCTMKNDVKVS